MVLADELRDAVLQAAIKGELTTTNKTDTSVKESICKISKQKEEIRLKKRARADAEFGDISTDEIPFSIPETWSWLRIGDIGIYKKGPFGSSLTKSMFVPHSNHSVKVYEQKNAIQKDYSLGEYYITEEYYNEKMNGFSVEPGDIIVSCAGTIGETYILPENATPGIINQALMRMNIVKAVNEDYFLIYFDHVLKQEARKASKGTAIKNIPAFEVFKKMLFPFPPIEEQQRIVDRVNELMEQIDKYAKMEQQLISLKDRFPGDLRSSILQAAMQGDLTERLDTDNSVNDLIKCSIEPEKKNKRGKKSKQMDIEIFDIPSTWRWTKMSECGATNIGLTYSPQNVSANDGTVVLRSSNIQNGKMDYSDIVKVDMDVPENKRCHIGDILICARNGSKKLVGKTAIIDREGDAFGAFMAIYRSECNPYIYYVLNSPHFRKSVLGGAETTTINQVTQDMIENYMFPLPPIEEQSRIVDRLNSLLPLIDELTE